MANNNMNPRFNNPRLGNHDLPASIPCLLGTIPPINPALGRLQQSYIVLSVPEVPPPVLPSRLAQAGKSMSMNDINNVHYAGDQSNRDDDIQHNRGGSFSGGRGVNRGGGAKRGGRNNRGRDDYDDRGGRDNKDRDDYDNMRGRGSRHKGDHDSRDKRGNRDRGEYDNTDELDNSDRDDFDKKGWRGNRDQDHSDNRGERGKRDRDAYYNRGGRGNRDRDGFDNRGRRGKIDRDVSDNKSGRGNRDKDDPDNRGRLGNKERDDDYSKDMRGNRDRDDFDNGDGRDKRDRDASDNRSGRGNIDKEKYGNRDGRDKRDRDDSDNSGKRGNRVRDDFDNRIWHGNRDRDDYDNGGGRCNRDIYDYDSTDGRGKRDRNYYANRDGCGNRDRYDSDNRSGSGNRDRDDYDNTDVRGNRDQDDYYNIGGRGNIDRDDYDSTDGRGKKDRKYYDNRGGCGNRDRYDSDNRDGSGSRDRDDYDNTDVRGNRDRDDYDNRGGRGNKDRDDYDSTDGRGKRYRNYNDNRGGWGNRDRYDSDNRGGFDNRDIYDYDNTDVRGNRDRDDYDNIGGRGNRDRDDYDSTDGSGKRDRNDYNNRGGCDNRGRNNNDYRGGRSNRGRDVSDKRGGRGNRGGFPQIRGGFLHGSKEGVMRKAYNIQNISQTNVSEKGSQKKGATMPNNFEQDDESRVTKIGDKGGKQRGAPSKTTQHTETELLEHDPIDECLNDVGGKKKKSNNRQRSKQISDRAETVARIDDDDDGDDDTELKDKKEIAMDQDALKGSNINLDDMKLINIKCLHTRLKRYKKKISELEKVGVTSTNLKERYKQISEIEREIKRRNVKEGKGKEYADNESLTCSDDILEDDDNANDGEQATKTKKSKERNTRNLDVDISNEMFNFVVRMYQGKGDPDEIRRESGILPVTMDAGNWFKYSKRFNTIERNGKVTAVFAFFKDISYCLDYIKKAGCTKPDCGRFHVCKDMLCGNCFYGDSNCKFSHNLLDERNIKIADSLGLSKVFSSEEICSILRVRYPHVCQAWNDIGTCNDGESCPELHLCATFVLNKCDKGPSCPLCHDRISPHNTPIVTAFKMEAWQEPMFKRMLYFKRTPKQQTEPIKDTSEEDFVQNVYLCHLDIVGDCERRNCGLQHSSNKLPYLWQVNIFGKWKTLEMQEDIENNYSNCSNCFTMTVDVQNVLKLWFEPEFKATLLSDENEVQTLIGLRRITTASYKDEEDGKESYKTQWRWYWQDDYSQWQLFEPDTLQHTLEAKYLFEQKEYLYTMENYKFSNTIDFTAMTQINKTTDKMCKLRRRPLYVSRQDVQSKIVLQSLAPASCIDIDLPATWVPLDVAHPFELVKLSETCPESINLRRDFYLTLEPSEQVIDHIYRVQNVSLWAAFCGHEKAMKLNAKRSGGDGSVEKRCLFHGTDSMDAVRGISINNFDFRLAGKNATMFGNGAYFAVDAKYSHCYTKGPNRFMFQAQVLVGEYTVGDRSYKRPPNKPGKDHELYDSCVDNVQNPRIFIVAEKNQYYPEYLIQYHDVRAI